MHVMWQLESNIEGMNCKFAIVKVKAQTRHLQHVPENASEDL